ncbi:hypothetical protein RJT34_13375 [Clitoria ternatea]|uniref:Uncharacterized protein n=1 Tax=Clitoria ternatea TaxID=43366 RepID=A0AAN9JNH1_CLITE
MVSLSRFDELLRGLGENSEPTDYREKEGGGSASGGCWVDGEDDKDGEILKFVEEALGKDEQSLKDLEASQASFETKLKVTEEELGLRKEN